MAELGTTIDHQAIEPGQNGFENLPSNWYVGHFTESEVKPTKNGKGIILNMTIEITEGEFTNRKVWDSINFQHESAQAQLIGQQRIKTICEAVEYTDLLTDSEVLHFKPFRFRLGLSKPQQGYEQKNEVKAYKPMSAAAPDSKPEGTTKAAAKPATTGAATGATGTTAGAKPAAGPSGGAARPWKQTA